MCCLEFRIHLLRAPCAGVVEGIRATAVAAGRCFTLAIGSDGELLSWGCGKLGRPGNAQRLAEPGQVRCSPRPVPALTAKLSERPCTSLKRCPASPHTCLQL